MAEARCWWKFKCRDCHGETEVVAVQDTQVAVGVLSEHATCWHCGSRQIEFIDLGKAP